MASFTLAVFVTFFRELILMSTRTTFPTDTFGNHSSFQSLTPVAGIPRYPALDGWRGISILLVVAAHLFPVGPKRWEMNGCFAALGMAIFFTLSGFLITTTLLRRPSVTEFLIRRLCRIVPLAWLFTIVALFVAKASVQQFAAQLLFFSNLPPFWLTAQTGHLWSLCVEMQFYMAIAVVCLVFGRKGLWSIPFLCLLVTAHRIQMHTTISIVTSLRLDEILAGGTLALICDVDQFAGFKKMLTWLSPWILLPLAVLASHDRSGAVAYLRPYLVASLVGTTILVKKEGGFARSLQARWLAYIAAISYALYILHPVAAWGWLGEGSRVAVYLKRLPALIVIFALAHLSSFYYEDYWIRAGKRWSRRVSASGGQRDGAGVKLASRKAASM